MRGELTRVYIVRCAGCDRTVFWPLDYDSRRASAAAFRAAGWSKTTHLGWLCPNCNPKKTVIHPGQPALFDLIPLDQPQHLTKPVIRLKAGKESFSAMPETTITIHLTEETGQMAYIGLATIAQDSTAHITRFEYFGEDDILSAISQALEKLRHLQQHPPQLKPGEAEPEPDISEDLDDEPDEGSGDLDEDEPDAEPVTAAATVISNEQLSLF